MKRQSGFSLIELMITLSIGLLISAAVIQLMTGNQVTERLNRALASTQESGRFIVSRMRKELLATGRYDSLSPNLDRSVDIVDEAAFVQNRPVLLPGDFAQDLSLGSLQGADGASDVLVVGAQAERDCRGYRLGYGVGQEFFVVNRYFVDGTKLKCQGYDGRVLRGLKLAPGAGNSAFTLLDEVHSFQVLYGVTNNVTTGFSGRPVRYVTADQLPAQRALGSTVITIRLAVLVKGDGEVIIDPVPSFRLLNETSITPSEKRLFKQFESTFTLRNVKNFTRNRKI